jgi:hypothetical protein
VFVFSRDGVEPLSYATFSNTYNTQSRIPGVLYKQLKNVAQKTTVKILKKCGAAQEENVAKCNRFFNTTAMRSGSLRSSVTADPNISSIPIPGSWTSTCTTP